MVKYRSLIHQTLHYFSRPHSDLRRDPVDAPNAWMGSTLQNRGAWCTTLDTEAHDHIAELIQGLTGTYQRLDALPREAIQTPILTAIVSKVHHALTAGLGFHVLEGLPVQELDKAGQEMLFWAFGLLLGVPGEQNTDGDLLGHVKDLEDPDKGRLYRTAQDIRFHCDAADVVGLLCLQEPRSGGASRIASSTAIYNHILTHHGHLIDRLYQDFALDLHGQRGVPYCYLPIARHYQNTLRLFYHSDYFRSGAAQTKAGLDSDAEALLDCFDRLAKDEAYGLGMTLKVGDAQFINNHTIIHARDAYEDGQSPETRRHLLRLWLSLDEPLPAAERWAKYKAYAQSAAMLAAGRLRGMRG